MTGLLAGTPAVIVPTITERESNARRFVALGAGEILMLVARPDGEKAIDAVEFGAAVNRVLKDAAYSHSASEYQNRCGNTAAPKPPQIGSSNSQLASASSLLLQLNRKVDLRARSWFFPGGSGLGVKPV
jgi:hypothetical protein